MVLAWCFVRDDNYSSNKIFTLVFFNILEPCKLPLKSAYQGFENQLYRVEIHEPGHIGKDKATLKWSRENGSVVFPIIDFIFDKASGITNVEVENLGKDDRTSIFAGNWMEFTNDECNLHNRAMPLLEVEKVDLEKKTVVLKGKRNDSFDIESKNHPLLRRWEGHCPMEHANEWIDLENGIQISFASKDSKEEEYYYQTGDYWTIPARTIKNDILWPQERDGENKLVPKAMEAEGVKHAYAPLAIIGPDEKSPVKDLRQVLNKAWK